MDLELSTLLSTSLRAVLAGPPEQVRDQLAELGWEDVVTESPDDALVLLFTEHGRALATTSLLDDVVLRVLAPELPADPRHVVAHPLTVAGAAEPGQPLTGVVLGPVAPDALLVLPVETADGPSLALVPAADAVVEPLASFDRSLGWSSVRAAAPADLLPAPSWPDALAAARRALAAELTSLAAEALRLAVEHTSSREQYGVPVASFQAVRHRLAESHVAVASASGLLDVAATVGSPFAAVVAKASAGRAHERVSAAAVQVCGAMGASLEHPLHRYVARGVVLDALLGSAPDLTAHLGEQLHATRTAPELVEL